MRASADRDVCIGSGNCVRLAPSVFDQDDAEGLVLVLEEEVAAADQVAVDQAVLQCPVGALGGVAAGAARSAAVTTRRGLL